MFRERYSIKQQQLFFVLAAYSIYNADVGYCQVCTVVAPRRIACNAARC